MGFRDDLDFGEKYQARLLDLIEFDTYEMASGRFKDWDVKIIKDNEAVYFEVKADKMAHRTGNIAIEYQCNKQPSGITATKADYWAYFIDETKKYYLIPTYIIQEAIRDKKYNRIVKGGDGWRAEMYLFSLDVFNEYCDDFN